MGIKTEPADLTNQQDGLIDSVDIKYEENYSTFSHIKVNLEKIKKEPPLENENDKNKW